MFRRIKIRTALSIMVFSLTALLLFVGILGLFAVQSGNKSFATVDTEVLPGLVALNESSELLLRGRLDLRLYESLVGSGDAEKAKVALERARGKIDNASAKWQEYLKYPQSSAEKPIAAEMATTRDALMKEFIDPAFAALEAGKLDEYRQRAGNQRRYTVPLIKPLKRWWHLKLKVLMSPIVTPAIGFSIWRLRCTFVSPVRWCWPRLPGR